MMGRARAVTVMVGGVLLVAGCGSAGDSEAVAGTTDAPAPVSRESAEPERAVPGPTPRAVPTSVRRGGFCDTITPEQIAERVGVEVGYELTQDLVPGEEYWPLPTPSTPQQTSQAWRCSYEPRSWDPSRSIGVQLEIGKRHRAVGDTARSVAGLAVPTEGPRPECTPGKGIAGDGDGAARVRCSPQELTRGTYHSPFADASYGGLVGDNQLECVVYGGNPAVRDAVVAATPAVCSLFLEAVTR